jgi:hypothetical protein
MAAGATYEPIATQTLASAAASITFSSIAATYTDLRLVLGNLVVASGTPSLQLQFNGDTATNYSNTYLAGDGATAISGKGTSQAQINSSFALNATTPIAIFVDIFSYAGSTNKTVLINEAGDKNGSGYTTARVGLWRSTAAITSITILNSTAVNYNIGTTATLYGIKAA